MIKGTVMRVIDGDTVVLQIRGRLAKSTPELSSIQGQLDAHALREKYLHKNVEVFIHGNDTHGRALITMRLAQDKGVRGHKTSRKARQPG